MFNPFIQITSDFLDWIAKINLIDISIKTPQYME